MNDETKTDDAVPGLNSDGLVPGQAVSFEQIVAADKARAARAKAEREESFRSQRGKAGAEPAGDGTANAKEPAGDANKPDEGENKEPAGNGTK